MSKQRKTLDAATLRRLATEADVDPRTIKNVLQDPDRSTTMASQRARAVLVKRGLVKARDEGSNT